MKFKPTKNEILFGLSGAGIVLGLMAAFVFGIKHPSPPPAFSPASDPYAKGIYAVGILESQQASGENVNVYPEVSGTVAEILVTEGQQVQKGMPLLKIDDSVQRATAEQQKSQAEAAHALLDELKAEPRAETLRVTEAQAESARATLKTAQDELAKQQKSYDLDPKSVSKDTLDNAKNAAKVAKANLDVAVRQYELTKAGAWSYDIQNQEKQATALDKAYESSSALLAKYTLIALADGSVLAINTALGSYISSQGVYDTYTQANEPALVLGSPQSTLNVRCYIDEILVHRLPPSDQIKAQLFIRGTDVKLPLEFVRVQPYVTPKIELSDEKTERVDVRVLPVIFKVEQPKDVKLYPGQQVDVYISD